MERIVVTHKGKEVYMVDATLIAEGKRTNRVSFEGKYQSWPCIHAEQVYPGRWAVAIEFFDIMNNQALFIRTKATKQVFDRNNQKVPAPKLRRIGKN